MPRAPQSTAIRPQTVTRLRMAITRLGRRLRQHAQAGITPSQLSALFTVDRRGPLTLGELAAIEEVQPPSITRVIGVLEEKGLVARTVDQQDRRVTLVDATPEASRQLQAIRRRRDAWLTQRIARLSPDEVERLERALPVLERLLEDRGEDRR